MKIAIASRCKRRRQLPRDPYVRKLDFPLLARQAPMLPLTRLRRGTLQRVAHRLIVSLGPQMGSE